MTEPADIAPVTPSASPAAVASSPHADASKDIWERIKEHKILQWSLGYLGAALALAHGAELLGHTFHWPEFVQRLILGVFIVGLPMVLTLAWYHGHKGLKGVGQGELMITSVLLVIGAGLLIVLVRAPDDHAEASAATTTASAPPSTPTIAVTPTAPRTAIAVMPFANLTGDATKDYLGEGMAEELINTLTKVPGLRVPARTSTFSYRGRNADAKQIAKDLGVGTILDGSVRSAGTTLRINAQLIDAQTDSHLWSETYERKFTDLFKLQDDLAKAIVQALQVNLKGASTASVTQAPPTQDLEAYRFYLQGSSLSDRITESNEIRAIEYFQQAIARDPKFARAHAAIATAFLRLGTLGLRPFEQTAAADRSARQALALDPNSALAHSALSSVNDARGNRLESEVHSLAALSLGGNDGFVRTIRAIHQRRGGYLRDALAEVHKAMDLAPANPWVISTVASLHSLSGRDAEALKYADLAVELAYPKDSPILANVYSDAALRAGRYAEAAEFAVKPLVVSDPEQVRTAEVIKLVHAALANSGQRASALAARERLYPPPATTKPGAADLTDVRPLPRQQFPLRITGCHGRGLHTG